LNVSIIARPTTAPTLAGGTVSGAAGTTVNLPITFNTGSASVASMQFSLAIPAGMTPGTAVAGSILTNAGKSVSQSISGSNLNIIVFGLNQTAIAGGTLVTVPLTLASNMAA